MALGGDWISITEAEDQILDRNALGDQIGAMEAVWRKIEERLHSGRVTARAAQSPSSYACTFKGHSDVPIPLSEEGAIPASFWFHYQAASQRQASAPLLIDSDSWAERRRDDFSFQLAEGLIEGGRIEGIALGVTVERSGLADLLAPLPGRPKGSRIDDNAIVDDAEREIGSGTRSPREAVRLYAPRMPGNCELRSKAKRLRERLKERGISFEREKVSRFNVA